MARDDENVLAAPEQWPDAVQAALDRRLQVPMHERSTSRLGFLAAPTLLSRFLSLALAAGLGGFSAEAVMARFSPRVALQEATVWSDKAHKEHEEALKQQREVASARLSLDDACEGQQDARRRQVCEKLKEEMQEAERDVDAHVRASERAAQRAGAALKHARAAHFASAARAACAAAQEAFGQAEKANDEAEQSVVRAELVSHIAVESGAGRSLAQIADQTVRRLRDARHPTEDATAVNTDQEMEELQQAESEALASLDRAQDALAELAEAKKILGKLRELDADLDGPLKSVSALSLQGAERVKQAQEAKQQTTARLQRKIADEEYSAASAAAEGGGNSSVLTVAGFVAWLIGRSAAKRGRRRDAERRQRLPFPLKGYQQTLEGRPRTRRSLAVRVRFQSAPPSPQALSGWLAGGDAGARVRPVAGGLLITRAHVQGPMARTNHAAYQWIAGLLEKVLVPLHGAHPIAMVEIQPVRRGKKPKDERVVDALAAAVVEDQTLVFPRTSE